MYSRTLVEIASQFVSNRFMGRNTALRVAATLVAAVALMVLGTSATTAGATGLTISTTTLPNGYVSSAYSAKLWASGGSGTGYTWSVSLGTLPAGLSLTTGVIHGTATVAGVSSFTVKVTDSASNSATAKLSITVEPALTVSTKSPAVGYYGYAYSTSLAAIGGTGTGYAWSVAAGTLPPGLVLTASTGAISGKPTAKGSSLVTFKVTDSLAHTATAALTITVNGAVTIGTSKVPVGYVKAKYSATLGAFGGTGTGYTWSIAAGSLPSGLILTASTGTIFGTPTVKQSSQVTFKVTDSLAHTGTASILVTVNAALAITTTESELPEGYLSSKYSTQLLASGGSGTGEVWSISVGSLPPGLTLSTTGLISGTPTGFNYNAVTILVKDSAGNTATNNFFFNIGDALDITSTVIPVGYLGSPYSTTLSAEFGSATGYKWSATNKLPQNFTLTNAGVLSGTPAVAGNSSIDLQVIDSASNVATATITLHINPKVTGCTNTATGTAYVELHGVYTFTLNRYNLTTNQRYASIGSFNADGLGNIRDGVVDSNGADWTSPTQNTFTGTYTVGSDGRGRMDLVIAGASPQTNTFCFALDSFDSTGLSYHAAAIQDDTTNTVSSGNFYHQTAAPSLLSVKGTWVLGLAGRKYDYVTGLPDFRQTTVGFVTLDGSGKVSAGEVDQNKDGLTGANVLANKYTAETALTGTYAMPVPTTGTPTGRGTLQVTSNGTKFTNFAFYPAGTNRIVLLEIDSAIPTSGGYNPVIEGEGLRRTGTAFSTATGLLGSSVRSQYFLTDGGTATEGEAVGIDVTVWDGKGNFTYTGDLNANGVSSTTSGSGTYTVDANGRFAVMVGGVCSPCGYLTKTDEGFAIDDSTDASLMTLEQQIVPIGGDFQISSFQGGYSVGSRYFIYANQQTTSGEVISNGAGRIPGTLDQNQQGGTLVNHTIVDTESATTTSGVHGRFLLYSAGNPLSSAFYIVNPNEALSIPLTGDSGLTQPLIQYIHQ